MFLDFDGTLSPIVPFAADARPLPGVGAVLSHLVTVVGRVAIVSGRPVSYLVEHLPPEIELHGLYGLESRIDGEVRARADSERWRPLIDEVVGDAVHALGHTGVDIEHKGLSLTLHFRRVPDAEDAAVTWARAAAARTSLHLRAAKMSLELHPPVTVDKGTVVEERSDGLRSVAYIGDDVGDLPAFAALDRLAERGITAVKVAVRTPDASGPSSRRRTTWSTGPRARSTCSAPSAAACLLSLRRWATGAGAGAGGGELVVEPVGRSAGLRDRPQAAGPVGPLLGGHHERLVEHPGGAGDVERGRPQRRGTEAFPSTGLGGEREHPGPFVDERALGRDQVQTVADRVDQEHVGPAQQRHGPREVILHVEQDRLPGVGAELLVDATDLVLDPSR